MTITHHEFWTVMHGMLFGALYLMAFAGGVANLWDLRASAPMDRPTMGLLTRLKVGIWAMMVSCWLTVIIGTYVVYPWYRNVDPMSPKSRLMADPLKTAWHTFGMEWKEHVTWLAPILTTAVAFLISYYGESLIKREDIRRVAFWMLVTAFAAAAVGGIFGAFINKAAPFIMG